jgi:hypothetical protein
MEFSIRNQMCSEGLATLEMFPTMELPAVKV